MEPASGGDRHRGGRRGHRGRPGHPPARFVARPQLASRSRHPMRRILARRADPVPAASPGDRAPQARSPRRRSAAGPSSSRSAATATRSMASSTRWACRRPSSAAGRCCRCAPLPRRSASRSSGTRTTILAASPRARGRTRAYPAFPACAREDPRVGRVLHLGCGFSPRARGRTRAYHVVVISGMSQQPAAATTTRSGGSS